MAAAPALPDGFVPLVASGRLRSDPEQIAKLLERQPPWPQVVAFAGAPGLRRYAIDLRLRVGGDSALTTFRKAAYVDLGLPRRRGDGWEVEIGWRAASAAPLFPVFSGLLVIGPERLRVDGIYAPPGGAVGRIADRALLHVAANATARWLLDEIDHAALGAAG